MALGFIVTGELQAKTMLVYGPTAGCLADTAPGFTVTIWDIPTWSAATTADFAAFDVIVFADCSAGTGCFGDPTIWSTAIANQGVWGPAVTGNVFIMGSDPQWHVDNGITPSSTIYTPIDFAANGTGTGLYVSLSCAFGGVPAGTVVSLLAPFGTFTVDGTTGGLNKAHIVSTSPALTGLTDASLSNWGFSVHEVFDSWPAGFNPLAIAIDAPPAYTAPDGSVGMVYILARGTTFIVTGTPTATPTPVFSSTQTLTPSQTRTPSLTLTSSLTLTPSSTFTETDTPTQTLTSTETLTPSETLTATQTLTSSHTRTPSQTHTSTRTFTQTYTGTPAIISLTKVVTPIRAGAGDLVTYTLTLQNQGGPVYNLVIWDSLSTNLSFVSSNDPSVVALSPSLLEWVLGTPVSWPVVKTIVARVNGNTPPGTIITNRFEAGYLHQGGVVDQVSNNAVFGVGGSLLVYPNPFSLSKAAGGTLKFVNLAPGATIEIRSLSGELVRSMGNTSIYAEWDGTNDERETVAPGVFFYLVFGGQGGETWKGKILVKP